MLDNCKCEGRACVAIVMLGSLGLLGLASSWVSFFSGSHWKSPCCCCFPRLPRVRDWIYWKYRLGTYPKLLNKFCLTQASNLSEWRSRVSYFMEVAIIWLMQVICVCISSKKKKKNSTRYLIEQNFQSSGQYQLGLFPWFQIPWILETYASYAKENVCWSHWPCWCWKQWSRHVIHVFVINFPAVAPSV